MNTLLSLLVGGRFLLGAPSSCHRCGSQCQHTCMLVQPGKFMAQGHRSTEQYGTRQKHDPCDAFMMGERELRRQILHLRVELEIMTGLLRASRQTTEVRTLLDIFRRRRANFERNGFNIGFSGSRTDPPSPPAELFPPSCTPEAACLRLALCCEAAADLHVTQNLPVRKSDLLSFAQTLREQANNVKRLPPVLLEQVIAQAAWNTSSAEPLFVIYDAGFWNHQSRGIGRNGACHLIFGGEAPRSVKTVPSLGFYPALRVILNGRYPNSHHSIHVIIESSSSIDIRASRPLARDEHPRLETDRIVREQLEERGVSLRDAAGFFRSF